MEVKGSEERAADNGARFYHFHNFPTKVGVVLFAATSQDDSYDGSIGSRVKYQGHE